MGYTIFLLGANTGALLLIGTVVRNCLSAYLKPHHFYIVVLAYLVFAFGITAYSYSIWYDALPFIGTSIFSLALLRKENRKLISRANVIGTLFWAIYALFAHSYLGAIFGMIIITSTLVGMARHEAWQIGRSYKTFAPNLMRSLFMKPSLKVNL